jgi:acetyltransferase-like isoleucine patch superfamily enzyme
MFRLLHRALWAYLYLYYRIKNALLTLVVGEEALAYVLHDSLLPLIVLKIGKAKIGKNVRLGRWLTLHESKGSFQNLEIGDDVFIGKNVLIDLSDKVNVGNRCGIGMNVTIITHLNFGDSKLSAEFPICKAPVEIFEDSVINWGCIVLKGTSIMREVIILPGSVVSGVLKEASTYGGNPARLIPRFPS